MTTLFESIARSVLDLVAWIWALSVWGKAALAFGVMVGGIAYVDWCQRWDRRHGL